jgi:hypothetical protein
MVKNKKEKETAMPETQDQVMSDSEPKQYCQSDVEWTDYVLSCLSEDEKINGNPTTDGLRRIFEIALNCSVISAESQVAQSPSIDNERRATVVHTLSYILNGGDPNDQTKYRTVSGAADVYWGNCDKIYRNHPVAVAETRAEGRALRRALKLRKVVAAEELAKDIDTNHLEENNIGKINSTQINFFEVFGKRLNINIHKLLEKLAIDNKNVYNISYDDAVKTITTLSSYQQSNDIPQDIIGYDPNWK